jgi:DNA-binding NarL/FixJ family response regulator
VKSDDRTPAASTVVNVAGASADRRIGAALEADGVRLAGTVRSAEEAVTQFEEPAPDAVVIQDLRGEVQAEISVLRRRFPDVRIVAVATFPTPVEVREALESGVDGVVLDEDVERCLALAVRAVCCGQIVLPESLRPAVLRPALSTREKQALAMVVMGFTNREIARKLYVTESTVKSHLSSAFRKLGVRSRAQATQVILDPEHGLGTGILAISDDGKADS